MARILSAEGICKSYGGVAVLRNVDFDIRRGEVHALIGENGAGKSTLIKTLSGDARPEEGSLFIEGRQVLFETPSDARQNGIVTIFQELAIVPELTVAENIVLGAEPTRGPAGQFVSRAKAEAVASEVLERFVPRGAIDPRQIAGRLSTAEQQIVEIARALTMDSPVIIMDEPTASLSPREAEALLAIIRQLRDAGTAIVFVSHRLNEVLDVADRITVLRGGERVTTIEACAVRAGDLIELMVGRPVSELYPPRNTRIGKPILKVEGLSRGGRFRDIDFELREGEILGFAGLVGAGRTEIMRAIFGLDEYDTGRIFLHGRQVKFASPKEAIRAGFGFVPEDRKFEGLVQSLAGRENLTLCAPSRTDAAGVVNWSKVRLTTERLRSALHIRGSLDIPVLGLSGGNQQKIVIGKWMHAGSKILILDEPTRGIDVGAKVEVYRLVQKLAAEGSAVLLVSSELPELCNVAHRIVVISGGRLEAEFSADGFDEKAILTAAFKAHLGHAAADGSAARSAISG